MPSRSLLARLAFAAGLAGLAWVLLELHGVFRGEREDRLRTLAEQQRTLEAYASRALADALADKLRTASPRIAAALADALLPAHDLFLARAGEQVLPRLAVPQADATGPARRIHAALRAGQKVDAEREDAPWQERLAIFTRAQAALARDDRSALEREVRELLRHRSRYRLRASLDLPCMVALMELLAERSAPERSFFAGVLREGFGTPGSVAFMPGLQAQLLEATPRLEQADRAFLAERIVALSERAGVPHGDFAARAAEGPGVRVAHDPAQRAPYLSAGWYIEPEADGRAEGMRAEVQRLVTDLAAEMHERELLRNGDQLALQEPDQGPQPVAALLPQVESPERERARAHAQALYSVKTGLLVLCGALAFGIAALANLAHQRRLRLADLRSSFVAAVSHDLRTPLASIRLQAETLMRRLRGNPEARDYPERIVRDVDGLSFLVENILSFNRLEHGGWQPRPASVSLRELVGALRADLERQMPHKVSVAIEAEEDLVLRADPDLMRLLFNNLLRNAVEHNEREPARVRVSWQRRGGRLLVHLADNGTGIAPGLQERVFQDFFRPERSTAKRGTGLGLAICRRILHAHGGEVRIVESSSEGTTFELDFPEAAP